MSTNLATDYLKRTNEIISKQNLFDLQRKQQSELELYLIDKFNQKDLYALRKIGPVMFIQVTNHLLELLDVPLYLTRHSPRSTKETSYRIFRFEEPGGDGHPNWCRNGFNGIIETWTTEDLSDLITAPVNFKQADVAPTSFCKGYEIAKLK